MSLYSAIFAKMTKMTRALILPPICILCHLKPTRDESCLCVACWRKANFIAPPYCALSGAPFSFEWPEGTKSRFVQISPPIYDHARAALRYDEDFAQSLVFRMKFGDRPEIARHVALWLWRAARDILPESDMICAVPLHWRRLWSRRFNQAAELARGLADLSAKPFHPDILIRARATRSQIGLRRAQRRTNVKGAFHIHPKGRDAIQGKNIILVDDVMTSGATMANCVTCLRKAGARRVDLVLLARVIHDYEMVV